MSKKFNREMDYDDDLDYRQDYYLEIKERRKNKRMRNALRSKNVDDLMRNLDDDEYDY
jgi:hypothetical protein